MPFKTWFVFSILEKTLNSAVKLSLVNVVLYLHVLNFVHHTKPLMTPKIKFLHHFMPSLLKFQFLIKIFLALIEQVLKFGFNIY
jgi:hypothetical protein